LVAACGSPELDCLGSAMNHEISCNPDDIRRCWLGYFDLLGAKRLIKSDDFISVFLTYSDAVTTFRKISSCRQKVCHVCFSDSFIVYAEDDSKESFWAIEGVSSQFCHDLLISEIPVRGAISCEDFYADSANQLFFGRALVEAFEYGEAQDWVDLILCPSATDQLAKLGSPVERRLNYAYADVPFKNHQEVKREGTLMRMVREAFRVLFRDRHTVRKVPACILGRWCLVNGHNLCLDSLRKLMAQASDEQIRKKYERAIDFIEQNKRAPQTSG
jgi:hypothetical protein